MKNCGYLTVLVASILQTIHLFCEARRLQDQVQKLEEERKRAALAAISVGRVGISEDEKSEAYNERHVIRVSML